jgi:16S rRNA processing protein RimM
MDAWAAMVTVGRIVRPHGNRGEVVVQSETDFGAGRFQPGATLVTCRGDAIERLTVRSSREMRGRWVVGFDGVDSIDAAETLRDAELRIAGEAVHPLEGGRFYTFDLVGCEVRTVTGRRVGTVEEVRLDTAVPLLVVRGDHEVLVPFAASICRAVDTTARVIEIDPPDGLIDLNDPNRRA